MKLMDIESEHLGIPDTEYKCTVRLPAAEFQRIIRGERHFCSQPSQKYFKVVYKQLRFSFALFSMLFAGYKIKESVEFRSLTPCLILSYLPISSHLILFSFLSSLSSFLDFPILRTSLDISTLITYIFLEIKTSEYWVTLADRKSVV